MIADFLCPQCSSSMDQFDDVGFVFCNGKNCGLFIENFGPQSHLVSNCGKGEEVKAHIIAGSSPEECCRKFKLQSFD